MNKDDWMPRLSLDGKIYCSPACGCKCTKAAHDAAHHAAAACAAHLGPGWSPVVWENGGWNWDVQNGCLRVTPPRHGGSEFTAWFELDGLQIIADAKTADDAVGFVVQDARGIAARIGQSLAAAIGGAQ